MQEVKKELRCKDCNSSQIYYRQKTQEYVCKHCGYAFKNKDDGDKE